MSERQEEDTIMLGEAGGDEFNRCIRAVDEVPEVDWEEIRAKCIRKHDAEVAKARLEVFRERFPVYEHFTLEHPDLKPFRDSLDKALSWEFGHKGLLLAGTHGSGKTYALFRNACDLMEQGKSVSWWSAQDLAGKINEQMEYGTDHAKGFVDQLAQRPVLVIDDLGQESPNKGSEDRIFAWIWSLIDKRYSLRKPMLISTNLKSNNLEKKYGYSRGTAIVRRLLESCEVIRF